MEIERRTLGRMNGELRIEPMTRRELDEVKGSRISGAGLQDRKLVRIGNTVHRPAGYWTPSVQELLRGLRAKGFDLAPKPLGIDSSGREVLEYIEGRDQGWPFIPEVLSDGGAEHLGWVAAQLKSALASYRCPAEARWQLADGAPRPGEQLQHGDLGPWNLLWDKSGRVVGILDWDFVEPGNPWYDTGYLAWFTVPFMDDERAHARGFPVPPNRMRRLEAFASGVGLSTRDLFLAALDAQKESEQRVLSRGSLPNGGQWKTFLRLGLHKNAAADREWTIANLATELLRRPISGF